MLSALVRSPLRSGILKIVDLNISLPTDSGCLIVICHTPWKRILVQWNRQNNFSHIISSINLTGNYMLIQSKGEGFIELRKIINLLHQNCRIVIAADVFNQHHNCLVQFLGYNKNASDFPVRLAIAANVPIKLALPIFLNNKICFIEGPLFNFSSTKISACHITQNIISLIHTEIQKHPEIWPSYVYKKHINNSS